MNQTLLLLIFKVLTISSCTQKQPHAEQVKIHYSDEKLDKLGITNHEYLSAASKHTIGLNRSANSEKKPTGILR